MQITLLGGYVFYMLWEAKNIYYLPFMMIMMMLSVFGYERLAQKRQPAAIGTLALAGPFPTLIVCASLITPVPAPEPVMQSLRGKGIFRREEAITKTLTQTFTARKNFTDLKAPVITKKKGSAYKVLLTKNGYKMAEKVFYKGRTIHPKGTFKKALTN
jgi:hypothetical protein